MADELKLVSVGTDLTQAEWEATSPIAFDSQATGDLAYASSATVIKRLAIPTVGDEVLGVASGIPAWVGGSRFGKHLALQAGEWTLPGWNLGALSGTLPLAAGRTILAEHRRH